MIGYGDETDRFHVYIVRPIWSPETLHMTDVVTGLCIEIAALGTFRRINRSRVRIYCNGLFIHGHGRGTARGLALRPVRS